MRASHRPPSPAAEGGFPAPGAEALAHSAQLRELIRAEIEAAGGSISFERYMELALYTPNLGYYSGGSRKFGPAGDFVTAPELSPLFSRCLAAQCAEVLDALGGGVILEAGAGSGTMAADLLAQLAAEGRLPERYLILERSAELRERQRATLAERVPEARVEWLEGLPEGPLRGVVVANELLDALAVRRFMIGEEGVQELAVGWEEGPVWRPRPADAPLAGAVAALEAELEAPFPRGYVSELCPALGAWIASLAEVLSAGALLFVDYGYPRREYYHPQRGGGTLLCHYRHRVHDDPFLWPGLQDITASVEFTAVAEAGVASGLALAGYTSQAHFLFGCGLDRLVAPREDEEADGGELALLERMRQVKLLTLPSEMGERFQAIAFLKGLELPLRGFSFSDQRGRL